MKRRKDRKRQVISDLNLTNLIDVVFTLLIIFMITAPMMTQGVQVDLPETESETVESNESIQVSIDDHGEIYVDHELVPLVDFRKRFAEVFAGRTETPVFINADKKVPYGLVVRVISEVQNVGVVKLGFLTVPLENQGGY
ncbi:MAG: biopolymer transporter ExbD [Chitinispirillales bacterium]|nr:biopolymer transporter ExbD [Chitinispirillales bacterium]